MAIVYVDVSVKIWHRVWLTYMVEFYNNLTLRSRRPQIDLNCWFLNSVERKGSRRFLWLEDWIQRVPLHCTSVQHGFSAEIVSGSEVALVCRKKRFWLFL